MKLSFRILAAFNIIVYSLSSNAAHAPETLCTKILIEKNLILAQQADGGNLEDVYRALGQCIKNNPCELMSMLENHKNINLKYVATMLPLSVVDNPDARYSELRQRRAVLVKTSCSSSSHIKSKLLNYIDNNPVNY